MSRKRRSIIRRVQRRMPLPPDLRAEMKKEVRKLASVRAEAVGASRDVRAKQIAYAKGIAQAKVAEAEEAFEKQRAMIVAEFEAKASERLLKSKVAPAT